MAGNWCHAATSSLNRSRAFSASLAGLLIWSDCNLSSLTRRWYGFFGKSRGERNSVSIIRYLSVSSVVLCPNLDRYCKSWRITLWPHKTVQLAMNDKNSSYERVCRTAPSWRTAPKSLICRLWTLTSVSMNAIKMLLLSWFVLVNEKDALKHPFHFQ